MPERKTDIQDAQRIATLLDKDLLRFSIVLVKTTRVLQSHLRQYAKLQG